MEYLKVKNWDKFQHYKHRSPRWIKLHRDLLQDYNFRILTDTQKLSLVLLWVLAANKGGLIPNDPNYLRVLCGLKHSPDLKTLIEQGWFTENASNPLAQSRVEKSIEEKIREVPVDNFPSQKQETPPAGESAKRGSAADMARLLARKHTSYP